MFPTQFNSYRTLNKQGEVVSFRFPMNRESLDTLIETCPNIPYIALAVLTPFEPPRDGSSAPARQYPTQWALSHLKLLLKQYGKEEYISNLRLLHDYIIRSGEVRNPIGLFTYRLRQTPMNTEKITV